MAAIIRTGVLNLLPLCFRGEITDLVLFYKCLNKDTKLHIENLTQTFDVNSSRRSGSCGVLLKPLLTRTETFKKSYFNRIASEWNSLPLLIRESSSLYSSKNKLMHHYITKLQQSFEINPLRAGENLLATIELFMLINNYIYNFSSFCLF